VNIRAARADECVSLMRLACSAKRHGGSAAEELETWLAQLGFRGESIHQQQTFVLGTNAGIVGVLQLATAMHPWFIEAAWVIAHVVRRGAGSGLLRQAPDHARSQGQDLLSIDADPHAEVFYLALGARRVGELTAPLRAAATRVRAATGAAHACRLKRCPQSPGLRRRCCLARTRRAVRACAGPAARARRARMAEAWHHRPCLAFPACGRARPSGP
jgi:hypothetical protein